VDCQKSQYPSLNVQTEVEEFIALSRAVHGYESDLEMLAMLQAYLDESVDKDHRMFVVAGFVGRSDAWSSLLHEWIDRIQPERLPRPIKAFHMTDCENGGGEFRDVLGWDKTSRTDLIIDLIDIICRHRVGMFGVGVPIKEYEALSPVTDQGLKLGYTQYHFAFQAAVAYLAAEMEDHEFPRHDTIAFFLDRNSPHESWANALHKHLQNSDQSWSHRIGSLTFNSKEKLRLLQVADLGAYESMKYLTNAVFTEGRSRRSFNKLAENHRVMKLSAFNADTLKEMVELKKANLMQFAKEPKP
jgi:hypothetical protein